MVSRQKNIGIFVFLTLTVLIAMLVLSDYNNRLYKDLAESTETTVSEIMQQQKFAFVAKTRDEASLIKAFATTLSYMGTSITSNETALRLLNNIRTGSFRMLILADKEGNAITSEGDELSVFGREYFQKAINGETYISEPFMAVGSTAPSIAISVPFSVDGEIVGVLAGTYYASELSSLFSGPFEGNGFDYVFDSDGHIVVKSENAPAVFEDNLLKLFSTAKFEKYDNYENIISNIRSNESGRTVYVDDGQKYIMLYSPLGINDWYIASVVPDVWVSGKANKITFRALTMTVLVILLFSVLIFYVFFVYNKSTKSLYSLAYTDRLTGEPNLELFRKNASALISQEGNYCAVKFDIERFNLLNELYGYSKGDEILKKVIGAIKQNIDVKNECYGKLHSDEFIMFVAFKTIDELDERFEKLERLMRDEVFSDIEFFAVFPTGRYIVQPDDDISGVYEKVNLAHKAAKKSRLLSNKICYYDDAMKKNLLLEKDIESRMETALKNSEFKLFLQPKYSLKDKSLVGVEALTRWVSLDGKLYPNDFIDVFERNGFITKLDYYIFEKACIFLANRVKKGMQAIPISINFSRLHLVNKHFIPNLFKIAKNYNIPCKFFELELSETVIADNEDVLCEVIEKAHEVGFKVAMDDFGTGYSSLGMLKNIEVDVIKIDRSFFCNSKDSARERSVLSVVMEMAKGLNIQTVAEGVETKEQFLLLKESGCDMAQGYYFKEPVSEEDYNE